MTALQMTDEDRRKADEEARRKAKENTKALQAKTKTDRQRLRAQAATLGHKLGRFTGTRNAKCKRCEASINTVAATQPCTKPKKTPRKKGAARA